MERTLHRYISLVRFNHISSENFLDKIYPLKELLPKDLVNDLLKFYITPNKKTIINIHSPRQISQPRQSKIDSVAFVGMVGMLK